MPSPTTQLSTLRPDLGGAIREFSFLSNRAKFIGTRIFPVLEVAVQSGSFGKIPLEQLLAPGDVSRAPRSGYNRRNWKFEEDAFATREYGCEEVIDDREAAIYANYFDAELIARDRALDRVLLEHETLVANSVFDAGTYTPTAVTNEWDDWDNATPINDVEARLRAFEERYAMTPNTLVINSLVARNLRNCAQIIEKIQNVRDVTQANITDADLANALGIERVEVAGGFVNTANPAQARDISRIWSNEYAALVHVARSNDISEPCVGRTLHYAGDGSSPSATVEEYRSEEVRGNVIRVRFDLQVKTIFPMVELLSNITT